jgi:hypothetical protein
MRSGSGNTSLRNFFHGDLLPLWNAAAPAVGIREMIMLSDWRTNAAEVPIDASV